MRKPFDLFFQSKLLFLEFGNLKVIDTRVTLIMFNAFREVLVFPAEFLQVRTHGHGRPPLTGF
ncbi:hypothetical protein JT55_09815 [Rhodovulum sp. NI22]|nr:hypothetical protein JT55_09815 [Rhodovulum sp. NI22]